MEVLEHPTDAVVREWQAARTAILDQLQALEEDTPAILTPWGVTVPNGDVYFTAPELACYTLDNPRPFILYRRSREPGGWPSDKWRTALLQIRNGIIELAPWQSPLKLPFGWRTAVYVAYHLRDERLEGGE